MSQTKSGRLKWRPLQPFGAVVEADLGQSLSTEDAAAFRQLMFEHQLLIFKGQKLSHPQHIEVMEYIGPVQRMQEFVHNISTDESQGVLGTQRLPYHSDVSFLKYPCPILSLHATDLVDGGSSTRFVSSVNALANLPGPLRKRIENLKAVHVMPWSAHGKLHRDIYDQAHLEKDTEKETPDWVPRYVHPLILRHPVTDKPLLYVNELLTARIEGWSLAESRALLDELFAHIYAEDNLVEHVWYKGDLIFWDNIALAHARGDVSSCGTRTLQKVILGKGTIVEQWPAYAQADQTLQNDGVERGL